MIKKRILPCSIQLQGEYGIKRYRGGVPIKLGKKRMEEIIKIKLTPDETSRSEQVCGGC